MHKRFDFHRIWIFKSVSSLLGKLSFELNNQRKKSQCLFLFFIASLSNQTCIRCVYVGTTLPSGTLALHHVYSITVVFEVALKRVWPFNLYFNLKSWFVKFVSNKFESYLCYLKIKEIMEAIITNHKVLFKNYARISFF